MENIVCKKCGAAADSLMAYKCDMCGVEFVTHDPGHACGEEHCVLKCSGCKNPETQCIC